MMLTKAQRRALEYVRDNEPVKLFPASGPSLSFVRKLVDQGLVRTEAPSAFGFIRYLLTDAGRAALEAQDD